MENFTLRDVFLFFLCRRENCVNLKFYKSKPKNIYSVQRFPPTVLVVSSCFAYNFGIDP